jgi:hypothetical protein
MTACRSHPEVLNTNKNQERYFDAKHCSFHLKAGLELAFTLTKCSQAPKQTSELSSVAQVAYQKFKAARNIVVAKPPKQQHYHQARAPR